MPLLDIMNPPGSFENGIRQREYDSKEVPAFSGKLLPEFNKRRNIKDMFARKPSITRGESAVEPGDSPQKSSLRSPDKNTNFMPTHQSLSGGSGNQSIVASSKMAEETKKPNSPERKRPAPSSSPLRTVKRSKSNTASNPPPNSGKGQQSLKGFFKPKSDQKSTEVSHDKLREKPSNKSNSISGLQYE